MDAPPSPAPSDEPAEASEPADPSAASASSSAESPELVTQCQDGGCALRTVCLAQGGRTGAPCGFMAACCTID